MIWHITIGYSNGPSIDCCRCRKGTALNDLSDVRRYSGALNMRR